MSSPTTPGTCGRERRQRSGRQIWVPSLRATDLAWRGVAARFEGLHFRATYLAAKLWPVAEERRGGGVATRFELNLAAKFESLHFRLDLVAIWVPNPRSFTSEQGRWWR
ncbi:hypothetical protein Fot_01328 [Forsythia ovata]|uniref:Uncharacterized protein n=1 Tax=Forsythia ovata TaxID=205694 RepID=A0ABD1X3P3_9LAMI